MSAPAASTVRTSSPSRAKSADRIDGAIHGVCMAWRLVSALADASLDPAVSLHQFVGFEDPLRALVRRRDHRLGQAVRDQLVRVVLAHEPAIRLA